MTLGEGKEYCARMEKAHELEAGGVLKEVLLQAKQEKRVTCGVYQAANKLNMNPNVSMLCLHAEDCLDDAVLRMHFALMEAFCWENSIPLLKVSNQDALFELLKDVEVQPDDPPEGAPTEKEDDDDPDYSWSSFSVTMEDLACVLIELPKDKNEMLARLLDLHHLMSRSTPFPAVSLAT